MILSLWGECFRSLQRLPECEQMVRGMSGVFYNPAGSAVAAGPVGVFQGGRGGCPAIWGFSEWLADRLVLSCPAHA